MSEEKYALANSMNESISGTTVEMLSEIGEAGVDMFLDEGVLKEIPLVSTAVSLFKIGTTIHDKHSLNKLFTFVQEMNSGILDEAQRLKYSEDFKTNKKKRSEEIEYLIIIIDRYVSYDKARQLAKVFLAYLDEKINWLDVCKYSEVIDRLLPGDYETLESSNEYRTERDLGTDALQRLVALGLVIEEIRKSNIQWEETGTVKIDDPEAMEKKERNYKRTDFGELFVEILSER